MIDRSVHDSIVRHFLEELTVWCAATNLRTWNDFSPEFREEIRESLQLIREEASEFDVLSLSAGVIAQLVADRGDEILDASYDYFRTGQHDG